MALSCIHDHVGDVDILKRSDRLPAGMTDRLADFEVFEEIIAAGQLGEWSCHQNAPLRIMWAALKIDRLERLKSITRSSF